MNLATAVSLRMPSNSSATICALLRITPSMLEIARDTQDAVDHELVTRYRPGQPRAGLLVQFAESKHLQGIAELRHREKSPGFVAYLVSPEAG